MEKKIRKTLYLPEWVGNLLDVEGEKYGGPGIVASAAISSFALLSDNEKKRILQNYRNKEIEIAYSKDAADIVAASGADVSKKKQKRRRRPSKAG